jgi:hypothetical protein
MTAISASTVSLKTLADGTLRISFDFEPRDAQDAFRLFASPGTHVGIAALKDGHAAVSDKPESHQGPLCKWLVLRCKEKDFQEWAGCSSENDAASFVKHKLGIESRTEIDGYPEIEDRFHRLIRIPYSKWLESRK